MNTLQAGFGRVNVNPMMGLPMRGYFKTRFTEAILDDLEINALALACGDTKLLLMSLDCCAMDTKDAERFVKNIAEATGLPEEAIITHATHTHTSTSSSVGIAGMAPLREQVLPAARLANRRISSSSSAVSSASSP